MEQGIINILLANDHKVLRSYIRNCLIKMPHIKVIAEAVSFPDLMEKLKIFQPDILMCDDRMPGGYLINDLPQIKEQYPDLKIIANTMHGDLDYLKKLVALTDGLVSFAASPEDFSKAAEAVHRNGFFYFFPGSKEND